MTSAELVQASGAVALMVIAFLAIILSRSATRFDAYGREVLFHLGGLIGSTAIVRFLVATDVLTTATARVVNGIIALVFLLIILQIWLVRHEEHKVRDRVRQQQRQHRRTIVA